MHSLRAAANNMIDADDSGRPPLVRALLNPDVYGGGVRDVELVETHISWVFLAGEHAYKVKKPVRLPFVDFSSLARRKRFCGEELRLNKRLAPALYLGVVPIGGTERHPVLGREPAIEYAVEMRRFAREARLDRQLARSALHTEDFLEFARVLARFHSELEPAPAETRLGGPAIIMRNALNNLRDLENDATDGDLDVVTELRDWTEKKCVRLEEAFARRKEAGMIREGHGDLHLENLVYLDGVITAFDALEFDPELRFMDVMNETAFVAMDLVAHGRPDLAHDFLTRYLEITGDYAGLEVLTFYLVYRALVRAKVTALRARQLGAREDATAIPYLEHALEFARGVPPVLVITHGFSGSGKTTVTDGLIGGLRAVRIRSDLERKRLHGYAADADTESRVAAGIYGEHASRATYAALERYAALALRAGFNVIVDAAFLRADERQAFAGLAARRGARFVVLDLACSEPVLRERIARRRSEGADASEASLAVLDHQLRDAEPLSGDEERVAVRVDTAVPVDASALVARIRAGG